MQDGTMSVHSIELVVQLGNVRSDDDPIHLVTCNYELGVKHESDSKGAEDGGLQRQPKMFHAGSKAQSTFTLKLHNVKNREVTQVKIGSYVQVVATMDPGSSGEVSFRVYNCRAFSNTSGVFVEHYILIDGCGDGTVIKSDRGFLTRARVISGQTLRMAQSVYFRAFSLLGSDQIKFECDFIVQTDDSLDGKSCKLSPGGRGKRAVLDLPLIQTDDILILPNDGPMNSANSITYYVNTEDDLPVNIDAFPQDRRLSTVIDKTPDFGEVMSRQPKVVSLLGQPLVIGLLVTVALLVIVLVAICLVAMATRTRLRTSSEGYSKAEMILDTTLYTGAPLSPLREDPGLF